MSEDPRPPQEAGRERLTESQAQLRRAVETREGRKLRARRTRADSVWFGLGMFGVVGWSVAVPTLIGVGLGVWIDSRHPGRISWTLTLLLVGIVVGCLNGWFWLKRQRDAVERGRGDG